MTHETSTALKITRGLFIGVLLILGLYAGYQIGALVVTAIAASTGGSDAVVAYRDTFASGYGRRVSLFVLTVLGGLLTYVIAIAAFNRLVRTGEHLRLMPANEKFATFLGVFLGLLLTVLLSPILLSIHSIGIVLTVLCGIAFVYLSVIAMTSMKDEIRLYLPSSAAASGPESKPERPKILDTNVIIDGRVADICRAGFLEGPIYIPGFVLDELQHIADSADGLKRARGRRGLDILNKMRTEMPLSVRAWDNADPNDRDEVDAKLVKLAKELNGMIVTNDFNLNKVAELQGVTVLNINELANALKPVVLPGEEMSVLIIKEGKEMNQGVGYLDDGTMIVVEGGRRRIGETLDVVTSSVLQTAAGKMIFANIRQMDDEETDPALVGRGPRRRY